MAAAIVAVERVAVLIGRCAIYEQLYLANDAPKNAKEGTEDLRCRLLALYTAILQALCRLIRVFQGRIVHVLYCLIIFLWAVHHAMHSEYLPNNHYIDSTSKTNSVHRRIYW